jgi:hypothetical protein
MDILGSHAVFSFSSQREARSFHRNMRHRPLF